MVPTYSLGLHIDTNQVSSGLLDFNTHYWFLKYLLKLHVPCLSSPETCRVSNWLQEKFIILECCTKERFSSKQALSLHINTVELPPCPPNAKLSRVYHHGSKPPWEWSTSPNSGQNIGANGMKNHCNQEVLGWVLFTLNLRLRWLMPWARDRGHCFEKCFLAAMHINNHTNELSWSIVAYTLHPISYSLVAWVTVEFLIVRTK